MTGVIWRMKTIATNRNIHISASDYFDSRVSRDTLGKMGISETNLANSSYLLNTLSHGNEIQDVVERPPLKCSIQSGNNHNLAAVCQCIGNLDNIGKELAFIDSNDAIWRHHFLQLTKGAGSDCLDATLFAVQLSTVVRASHLFIRVAVVTGKLDDETSLVGMLISLDASLQLCCFPRKHGAQNQLDVAALHAAKGGRAP